MATRYFALICGIVYLLVGILGFLPGTLTASSGPELQVNGFAGNLLGLFPVNWLLSAVHLLLGLAGVLAYRSFAGSRAYAQGLAMGCALLAIMGLIPGLNTTFGLMPLYGNSIWLHALTALVAAYFGFVVRIEALGGGGLPARLPERAGSPL